MQEENLLKMIIEKQTWEEIIYHIVSFEGLDPWNIDLIRLTDSFLRYIKKLKTLDFRIPGKVILVAAILLKLKSEILLPMKRREEYFPEEEPTIDEFEKIREQISGIDFKPSIRRHIKRKITLDELVDALRKAMRVKEKKERMKKVLGRRMRRGIDVEEVDIEKRIGDLMSEIDGLLLKLKSDKIEFSRIVKEWERDEIVRHFMPLLHLSKRGKIITEQDRFFEEIFISKKN